MNLIKAELQDLGFRALHPLRHAVIAKRIRTPAGDAARGDGDRSRRALAQRLAQEGMPYRLVSRVQDAVEHLQEDARGSARASTR